MMKEENSPSDKSGGSSFGGKRRIRRRTFEYLYVPAVYSVIALIIILPAFFKAFSASEKYIKKLESTFVQTDGDIEISDAFSPENPKPGARVGSLVCEKAGIKEQIYYGENRASLRNGLALSEQGTLFGDGTAYVTGYGTSALKSASEIEEGFDIIITTSYTVYNYRVVQITDNPAGADADLILSCTASENSLNAPYGYFVLADLISQTPLAADKEAQ